MDAVGALGGASNLMNSLHGLRDAGSALSEAFDELNIQQAFAGGNAAAGAFTIALQLGLALIHETNNALTDTIAAYDKASKTAESFYEAKEKAAKSGNSADRLTDSGMPPEVEKAIKELGAIQLGYAAQGTWTRRFQEIGKGLEFIGGDFSGGDQDERLSEGKGIASRNRELEQNNKEEQARRQFAKDAQAHNFRQEQEEYKKWAREQAEIDKREETERLEGNKRVAAEEMSSFEKFLGLSARREEMAERFAKAEERSAKMAPEREPAFQSKIEGLEATYNRIQTAASSEDPMEKSRQQQKELHEQRTTLLKEQHAEALRKQDEAIAAAREAAGTG